MGMFDTVSCEYPLPDPRHQGLEFQTKSLESLLDHYLITGDGRLMRLARHHGVGPERDVEWPIHGDLVFYTSEDTPERTWIEYVARFTHGRVEWIRPRARAASTAHDVEVIGPGWYFLPDAQDEQVAPSPAGGPPAEEDAAARERAEESLLGRLREEREALQKLLADCSDHWGYEDPIYRFYHQSRKVYALQSRTRAIVARLQALAPERPLNSWFLDIVREGTGKTFQLEDNARWKEVARPILEAFFHARFFLEMAVRYANLEAPPRPLPSGYAALLYLYGLR
jgi:hypothetical protein